MSFIQCKLSTPERLVQGCQGRTRARLSLPRHLSGKMDSKQWITGASGSRQEEAEVYRTTASASSTGRWTELAGPKEGHCSEPISSKQLKPTGGNSLGSQSAHLCRVVFGPGPGQGGGVSGDAPWAGRVLHSEVPRLGDQWPP